MSKEKGFCDVCGTEIEVTMCCSSFDCGCMGLPTEPPICSEKCYDTCFHKKVLEAGTSVYTPYSPW